MQSLWWQIFDILGTIAFALSGTFVGISRRMDIFGVFVLASVTAIGGGILRDILMGHIPPVALTNAKYFWIILITFILASAFHRYFRAQQGMLEHFKVIYLLSDAIGLGSFTVTGTLLGCLVFPDYWVLDILLGVITAVGGGILRDLLAGTVPGVFLHDIYASASLIGAVVLYVTLVWWGIPMDIAGIACFLVTVVIRILSLVLHWNLPRVRRRKGKGFL